MPSAPPSAVHVSAVHVSAPAASASASAPAAHVVLYTNPRCPFGRRGMIAVREKALHMDSTFQEVLIPLAGDLKKLQAGGFEAIPHLAEMFPGRTVEDLLAIKEEYKRDINPTGEVPTLVVNGDIVREADVVAEYVADRFADRGTPLMPQDPLLRSKVRNYIKIINGSNGVSAMYGLVMNQDPTKDEAMRARLYQGFADFVRLASPTGPYFCGEEFSVADILLMPMYDQFRVVIPFYRGAEFFPSNTRANPWVPRMGRWAAAVEARQSFQDCAQGLEQYVKAYASYAAERGVSEFGK